MESQARESVLVVDDEPEVLFALEDILADQFNVLKTSSPQAALETIDSQSDIAVIISDQRMPRMRGDQLLATCRKACDATRILLTGFSDLSAVVRAINDGGVFAYISKPWNTEDLRLKVKKAAEHFRMARELDEQRRLLKSIMDHMAEGVIVANPDGDVLLSNEGAGRMFDFTVHAVPFSSWARAYGLYLPDRKTPLPLDENPLVRATRGERTNGMEFVIKSEKTPDRIVVATATPFDEHDESVRGGVCVLRDVTEQRLLEEQFQQAQKMEAFGRLAGGVAHDFNNILAIISSYASIVTENLADADENAADMREILTATQRGAALTRQLLAFSRRKMIQPQVIIIDDVVMGVKQMLGRVLRDDIDLRMALSASGARIRGDAGQIEQVLLNLVVNASDAMPNGGRLTIETRNIVLDEEYVAHPGVPPGSYVLIAVSDTGAGMDHETQARIFEPFFTTKEVGKGTGLGLSTVYGIVQQSGGHILVYSEVRHGTCFKIYLPRVDDVPDEAQRRPASIAPSLSDATVLVVDDDRELRKVTARILQRWGFTVIEGTSADEAIRLSGEADPDVDVLLTDVVMPRMNGVTLAEELSRRNPALRVVLMSGYPGEALANHDVLQHRYVNLEKPFTPTELVNKVKEALAGDPTAT